METGERLTPERIQVLVAHYLEKEFGVEDGRPYILDESISADGDWWMVPVVSKLEKTAMFEYYGRLADVEKAIHAERGLDVELIPASPRVAA